MELEEDIIVEGFHQRVLKSKKRKCDMITAFPAMNYSQED